MLHWFKIWTWTSFPFGRIHTGGNQKGAHSKCSQQTARTVLSASGNICRGYVAPKITAMLIFSRDSHYEMPIDRKNVTQFLNILMSRTTSYILCIKYTFIWHLTQAINCHAQFQQQLFVKRAWYSLRSAKKKNKQHHSTSIFLLTKYTKYIWSCKNPCLTQTW